jgi:hypothetical protein
MSIVHCIAIAVFSLSTNLAFSHEVSFSSKLQVSSDEESDVSHHLSYFSLNKSGENPARDELENDADGNYDWRERNRAPFVHFLADDDDFGWNNDDEPTSAPQRYPWRYPLPPSVGPRDT